MIAPPGAGAAGEPPSERIDHLVVAVWRRADGTMEVQVIDARRRRKLVALASREGAQLAGKLAVASGGRQVSQLGDLHVAVRDRSDGTTRVLVIDARRPQELLALVPEEAVRLAGTLAAASIRPRAVELLDPAKALFWRYAACTHGCVLAQDPAGQWHHVYAAQVPRTHKPTPRLAGGGT